ncbi:FtsW/RodA/SpoVE family cell cycle protein [Candidatus Parcubacteria bacterium]|nr:FtsW/RodA/SpoVE family cell cycle protein [Candidatus Parcubacteria bacterium]
MEKNNNLFLILLFFIVTLGILILESASIYASQKYYQENFYFVKRQIFLGILPSLFFFFLILKLPWKFFQKGAFLIFLLGFLILVLTLVPPFSKEIRGGKRWINLGFFSFQPAELFKIVLILYLAFWLEGKAKKTKGGVKESFPFFLTILILVSLLFLLQPDVSSLIVILAISLCAFFVAKAPLWQFFIIFLLGLALVPPIIFLAPYRLNRILGFLNPNLDPLGKGYHFIQAEIAIGAGGIKGRGLGGSMQKLGYLPLAFSDSIFAVWAEETGFLGVFFLFVLFWFLFFEIFQIGLKTNILFQKIIAHSILTWWAVQFLLNIASQVKLFPLAGIPLPFLSYGGSHLMAELIGAAFLVKIQR